MKWDRFDKHPFSPSTTGPLHQHQLELKLSLESDGNHQELLEGQTLNHLQRGTNPAYPLQFWPPTGRFWGTPAFSCGTLPSEWKPLICHHRHWPLWWHSRQNQLGRTAESVTGTSAATVTGNFEHREVLFDIVLVSRGFLSSPPVEIVKSIVLAGLLIDSPAISQTFISLPIPEKHGQMIKLIQTIYIYIYNYYYYYYLLQKSLVVQASILKQNIQNIWWPSWLPFSTMQLLVGVNA